MTYLLSLNFKVQSVQKQSLYFKACIALKTGAECVASTKTECCVLYCKIVICLIQAKLLKRQRAFPLMGLPNGWD